jgi:hypothetical protein
MGKYVLSMPKLCGQVKVDERKKGLLKGGLVGGVENKTPRL